MENSRFCAPRKTKQGETDILSMPDLQKTDIGIFSNDREFVRGCLISDFANGFQRLEPEISPLGLILQNYLN